MSKREKPLGRLKGRLRASGASLALMIVALLIALGGGAFAASAVLSAKQKNEVRRLARVEAKRLLGAYGAAGPPGAKGERGELGEAGAKGEPGQTGPRGEKGETGSQGPKGTEGLNGESVVLTPIPQGIFGTCQAQENEGGVEVRLKGQVPGTGQEICNGKEGSPWSKTGRAPLFAVETGTYAFSGAQATGPEYVPISFSVPLPEALQKSQVHFQSEANFADFDGAGHLGTGCKAHYFEPIGFPATENANPDGALCIYQAPGSGFENAVFEGVFPIAGEGPLGGTVVGAVMKFSIIGGATGHGMGSYAVTVP